MEQVWAALAGAALGGVLAFGAAEWSFHRSRDIAEAEDVQQERQLLDGLIVEIDMAMKLAGRASPTQLPVVYLHNSMPLCRYMDGAQASIFLDYAQAVVRYNGRVGRLISYGTGKRAAGESPGPEKPEDHAKEVIRAGPVAREMLTNLVDKYTEVRRRTARSTRARGS